MSESAVSHRVRELEEALTVSLFHRSSEGVEPTKAGMVFFGDARAALNVLDSAALNAASASVGTTGTLVVGLYTSITAGRLRAVLMEFIALHPGVEVRFVEGSRALIVEGLRSRLIDVSILIGEPDAQIGEATPLWNEQVFAVFREDHSLAGSREVSWAELSGETFIVSTRDSGPEAVGVLSTHLGRAGHRPSIRAHQVSCETIHEMIGMGFGATLAIESDLGQRSVNLRAIPVREGGRDELVPMTAYRDAENDNPPLRRFWSLLKKAAAQTQIRAQYVS